MDSWTCYELSWLNQKGVPRNSVLYFSYNCNSKFFIESKSLKLYLFSLNNKRFDSQEQLILTIKEDLELALKTEVTIEISDEPRRIITHENSINDIDIELITPPGISYKPWVLDYAANSSNLNQNAVRNFDGRNNMEQVTIDNPLAGNYTLNV